MPVRNARNEKDCVATPGPPPVRAKGISNSFERLGQAEQEHDHDGRLQQGQEDRRQHLPTARSINDGGLVKLIGHRLERCEEDQEAERGPLPNVDEDDAGQRPVRM